MGVRGRSAGTKARRDESAPGRTEAQERKRKKKNERPAQQEPSERGKNRHAEAGEQRPESTQSPPPTRAKPQSVGALDNAPKQPRSEDGTNRHNKKGKVAVRLSEERNGESARRLARNGTERAREGLAERRNEDRAEASRTTPQEKNQNFCSCFARLRAERRREASRSTRKKRRDEASRSTRTQRRDEASRTTALPNRFNTNSFRPS